MRSYAEFAGWPTLHALDNELILLGSDSISLQALKKLYTMSSTNPERYLWRLANRSRLHQVKHRDLVAIA